MKPKGPLFLLFDNRIDFCTDEGRRGDCRLDDVESPLSALVFFLPRLFSRVCGRAAKAPDCKSGVCGLRRCESYRTHHDGKQEGAWCHRRTRWHTKPPVSYHIRRCPLNFGEGTPKRSGTGLENRRDQAPVGVRIFHPPPTLNDERRVPAGRLCASIMNHHFAFIASSEPVAQRNESASLRSLRSRVRVAPGSLFNYSGVV